VIEEEGAVRVVLRVARVVAQVREAVDPIAGKLV
jgi:hypothetical protein